MFERLTDRARKVMAIAQREAERLNHEYVAPEHILIALVTEGAGVAAIVLKNHDIDARKVRLEVERLVKPGPDMVVMGKLPQTPKGKKALEYAIEEARAMNHGYAGTEHLLLGLLRDEDGNAAKVLFNLGLGPERVREEVRDLLGINEQDASSAGDDEGPPPLEQEDEIASPLTLYFDATEFSDEDIVKMIKLISMLYAKQGGDALVIEGITVLEPALVPVEA